MRLNQWKQKLAAHLRRKAAALDPAPPIPVVLSAEDADILSRIDDLGRVIAVERTFGGGGYQFTGEFGAFILPSPRFASLRRMDCVTAEGELTARGECVVREGILEFNVGPRQGAAEINEETVPQFVKVAG